MRPVPSSSGNCASICVGEVLMRGIATSFAVTQTPPRLRGKGAAVAAAASARLVPRIVMREPGETGPGRLLAMFTTPLAVKEGARPAAGLNDTTLRPETVRRYALLLLSIAIPRASNCVWLFTPSSSAVARGGHWRVPVGAPGLRGGVSVHCFRQKNRR